MGAFVKNAMLSAYLASALFLATGWAAAAFDPTAPPKIRSAGTESAREEANLAWVRVNGKSSIAWYGGTTVKLGDAVEGGRVTAIREDHIVISGRGGRRAIYLLDQSIRSQLQIPQRPPR